MDTLVVSVGSVKHGIRFFDASAVISDPTRMFFSIDTSFSVVFFALVCCVAVMAPLVPHIWRHRVGWFAYAVPLALILICGSMLYLKTSGDLMSASSDAEGLRGSAMHLANRWLQRAGDLVARHVAVGPGGYVALLGSCMLAWQGARKFLRTPA